MSIIYAHWQKPMPRAVTACKYTTKFPSPQISKPHSKPHREYIENG